MDRHRDRGRRRGLRVLQGPVRGQGLPRQRGQQHHHRRAGEGRQGHRGNSTKVKPNPGKPDPDTPGVDPKNPDEHKSGFIFNNAIKTGTITGTDKDLKVSKEVIGKYADRTRGFGFKLTLTKPADFEGTTAKAKVYDSATGQPAKSDQGAEITYEFTYGQEGTFTLKHGQYLQFEDGMANGTTYVLIEDGVATYTAAAKTVSGGGQPVEATYAADGKSAIASGNGVSTAGTASTKGANTNEVTNTLEDVTPTGIAISVLPYAVMVLVPVDAGVLAAVSHSAGTYVCNAVLFSVLDALCPSRSTARAGFVHVPNSPEQACRLAGEAPSMPVALMLQGIVSGLECACSWG